MDSKINQEHGADASRSEADMACFASSRMYCAKGVEVGDRMCHMEKRGIV